MVDCTAAEEVSEMYLEWFKMGVHVVTPNKKVKDLHARRHTNLIFPKFLVSN